MQSAFRDNLLDYDVAFRSIEALVASESPGINPLSHTIFLSHGHKTERAIVLLHGYTSSPWMFRLLARSLFEQGMNVLVPLAPRHGLADRLTDELAGLGEDELVNWAARALDLAHGLGQRVGLAGFSMGGVMALWAARFRTDLDFAALISPAVAYSFLPVSITGPLAQVVSGLPNVFAWWDGELRDKAFPASHGYPRYGTRGFGIFTALGHKVWKRSVRHPPAACKVLFILNPAEVALNNGRAQEIHRRWHQMVGDRSTIYQFDKELDLPHDFIDPEQPRAKLDVTNPKLVELLTTGW